MAGPTGAVVGKELRGWQRDPAQSLGLLLGLLISVLNVGVPAVAFRAAARSEGWDTLVLLPWVGLAAVAFTCMSAVNLYGNEGTALWLLRMLPGSERADVRGRQLAWLLVTGSALVALTVGLTALAGQGWAWPLVLAALPAMLAGTAGLMMVVSVVMPVKQKDPHRRTGPFDTGDDPDASGAVLGQGWLMGLAAVLVAAPGCALVLLGATGDQPWLQAAGVGVGTAVGVGLWWWGGRFAARRLADRGAELMDLLHLGPGAVGRRGAARPREPEVQLPGWKSAAVSVAWVVAALCVFPQGLVPLVFNLLEVDPETRVWFLARYMPTGGLQISVAVGFIAAGALVAWWARSAVKRATRQAEGSDQRPAARGSR